MNLPDVFTDLAVAVGLGLLVGLQRESQARAAGLRTFALVTLAGAISGQLIPIAGGWVVAAGLLAIGALSAVEHHVESEQGKSGLTTEMAMLAMYLVGVYLTINNRAAVVVGGAVAVLLQAKAPFRRIMERLGSGDVRAIMLFALLSLVILPVLPNRDFGPWGVFNLFKIWLLVVLIVGINLAGYIAWKFMRSDTGALMSGLIGGVVSSTATTVTYARRSRDADAATPIAAVVIVVATAVTVIRVIVEVAIVAPPILRSVALPLGLILALSIAISLVLWWHVRGQEADMPDQGNPTMLRAALAFGAMYAVVLLAVAWTKHWIGQKGLYLVAAVAGLTDVDAITLSTAQMARVGQIDAGTTWRVIVIAFLSNLVFKAGIVAVMGSRRLFVAVSILFAILGAGAGLIMLLF